VVDLADFAESVELDHLGDGRFVRRPSPGIGGGFVFAGLVSAQMMKAAGARLPASPRSISTIYTAIIRPDEPYEIFVEPIHTGRQLTAMTITATQSGRTCASAQSVLGPSVPDLIRHSRAARPIGPPEAATPSSSFPNLAGEVRVVGAVDLARSDQSVRPVFSAWRRVHDLAPDTNLAPAVVAHDANSFLPGTALLPHAGFSLSDAHRRIMTVITASRVVFHQPIDLRQWVLFDCESTFAGEGWAFGTGTVSAESGALLASFSQETMIRALPSRERE
jgi:acyl-CoA thioesterase II